MKKGFFRENLIYFVLFTAIVLQAVDFFYAESNNGTTTVYSQGIAPNLVLTGYKDETIPTEDEILEGKTNLEIFEYYVENHKYIMHGGGSIKGINYTNSYDALDLNYKKGNRIFEIDLNFTSDGHLVLVHGWTQYDYENRLGVTYNKKKPKMSLSTFKNTLLHNRYQTMSIYDLIDFMETHPYSYFILNIKNGSKKSISKKGLKQVVKAANYDKNILDRLIVWGYNDNIISLAKDIYDFKLITLSYSNLSSMPKSIKTRSDVIEYCKENGITSIILSTRSFDESLVKLAKEAGIHIFVFTLDSENVSNKYLNRGASMILTNHLRN